MELAGIFHFIQTNKPSPGKHGTRPSEQASISVRMPANISLIGEFIKTTDLAELADDCELAGLVDEANAGDLSDLVSGLQGRISKMGIPQKQIRKRWHVFRARIMTIHSPAFTSNPPQLHHQNTTSNNPFLPKPPAKTRLPPPPKNYFKNVHFGFFGDDAGGGRPILIFKVEDLSAPNPSKLSASGE